MCAAATTTTKHQRVLCKRLKEENLERLRCVCCLYLVRSAFSSLLRWCLLRRDDVDTISGGRVSKFDVMTRRRRRMGLAHYYLQSANTMYIFLLSSRPDETLGKRVQTFASGWVLLCGRGFGKCTQQWRGWGWAAGGSRSLFDALYDGMIRN